MPHRSNTKHPLLVIFSVVCYQVMSSFQHHLSFAHSSDWTFESLCAVRVVGQKIISMLSNFQCLS